LDRVAGESVSMFDVRREAKKFLVATFTDGTDIVGFFSVWQPLR
jgi:hypothetical protein